MRTKNFWLLLMFLLAPSIGVSKEIIKGMAEINGNLNFSLTSLNVENDDHGALSSDTITVSASILYYVKDNIGVGLTSNYVSIQSSSKDYLENRSTTMYGVEGAYNISFNENFSMKILVVIAKTSSKMSINDGRQKSKGSAWILGLGWAYFVAHNISVNTKVTYLNMSQKIDASSEKIKMNGLITDFGISVYFE